MKRLAIVAVATAASVPFAVSQAAPAAPAAPAVAASAEAHAARAAKLELRHTTIGRILTNRRGFTLFVFTRDTRNHDTCVTISGCTGVWPLLTSHDRPRLGLGLRRSLVGRIKLASGARQVTYAGHPLYMYIASSGPGDTSYVGVSQFGGRWYALNAAGHIVK
jgi:predicted lipoprotein with Yx(FWY)xxD motif